MTNMLCFQNVILSTKLAFPSFTGCQRGLQYFERRRIMSESKGPPEASKGPTNNIKEAYKLRRRFQYDIIMLQTLQQ